jgi:hypothetical protein
MRSIAEFTKTTLIGGVLVLMPIYLSMLSRSATTAPSRSRYCLTSRS